MKQMWKKWITIVLLGTCLVSFTAYGATQEASSEADIETSLIQSAQSVVETIVSLDDETMEYYKNSGDAFTIAAIEAWENNRDELGGLKEIGNGSMETSGEEITITIPAKFEKADADIIMTFDAAYSATGISIDVQYPMSVLLERAALNTLMGMGIVFLVLIFLTFLISLFKYIPDLADKFQKKPEAMPATPTAVSADKTSADDHVSEENLIDDGELIAVITAAIAAAGHTATDGFVVRSIKKANKKNWHKA